MWELILTDTKISPRGNLGAVSTNEGIILVGGYTSPNAKKDAWMFHPAKNTMELLTKDMGVAVAPGHYPLLNDRKNNRIVVGCVLEGGRVFSMPLPTC